jgi:CheY-like chemotaxis protein
MLAPLALEGLSILLVEDNFLLAEVTKDLLEQSGCRVVGPAGRLESGMRLARQEQLDAAILDIDLQGELSFAIAEVLRDRGVPFMFVTGYADPGIVPSSLGRAARLDKPVADDQLIGSLAELCGVPMA